jgi:hypothetical protein
MTQPENQAEALTSLEAVKELIGMVRAEAASWREPQDYEPRDAVEEAAFLDVVANTLEALASLTEAPAVPVVNDPDLLAFVGRIAADNPVFAKGADKKRIFEARELVAKVAAAEAAPPVKAAPVVNDLIKRLRNDDTSMDFPEWCRQMRALCDEAADALAALTSPPVKAAAVDGDCSECDGAGFKDKGGARLTLARTVCGKCGGSGRLAALASQNAVEGEAVAWRSPSEAYVWLQQFANEEKGIDRDQVSKLARALYSRPAAADAGVREALDSDGTIEACRVIAALTIAEEGESYEDLLRIIDAARETATNALREPAQPMNASPMKALRIAQEFLRRFIVDTDPIGLMVPDEMDHNEFTSAWVETNDAIDAALSLAAKREQAR